MSCGFKGPLYLPPQKNMNKVNNTKESSAKDIDMTESPSMSRESPVIYNKYKNESGESALFNTENHESF